MNLVIADEAPLTREKLVDALNEIGAFTGHRYQYNEPWHFWYGDPPKTPEQELMHRINARLRSVR